LLLSADALTAYSGAAAPRRRFLLLLAVSLLGWPTSPHAKRMLLLSAEPRGIRMMMGH
jgi:hypothetical protein